MAKEIKKLILVVEDEPSLLHVITHKLEKDGFDTITASSGEEALQVLEKTKPIDLIWLDLLMPGMGGLKFLEIIKNNENYKNIPVVVVSVSAGVDTLKKVSEYNILEYIMKGQTDLNHIVERVKKHLNSAK